MSVPADNLHFAQTKPPEYGFVSMGKIENIDGLKAAIVELKARSSRAGTGLAARFSDAGALRRTLWTLTPWGKKKNRKQPDADQQISPTTGRNHPQTISNLWH